MRLDYPDFAGHGLCKKNALSVDLVKQVVGGRKETS